MEAERFVDTVIQEKFDYTRWQRDYFDGKTPEEIRQKANGEIPTVGMLYGFDPE